MPYVVNAVSTRAILSSMTLSAPLGHQPGDLLLVFVSQDVGGTAINVTGYTEIGAQSQTQAQRLAVFYKFASSSSEQVSVQSNGGWNVVSIVVMRHVNPTAPIHAFVKTDSANSTTAYLDSGQVTTTSNGCLLLYAFSFDGSAGGAAPDDNQLFNLTRENGEITQSVGYKLQETAGTSSVIRMRHEQASEGGSLMLLAIADATPASPKLPAVLTQQPQILGRLGAGPTIDASIRSFYRHESLTIVSNLATIVPSVLFGKNIAAPSSQSVTAGTVNDSNWTATANAYYQTSWGGMGGLLYSISPTDFSNRLFSYEFSHTSWGAQEFLGCYFEDSSGRWAAYRVTDAYDLLTGTTYRVFLDLSGTVPDQASATPLDPTQIVKFAFLWGFESGSNSGGVHIRNALLVSPIIAVRGISEQPLTFSIIGALANGWGAAHKIIYSQGSGQTLLMVPVQIGDGTQKTVFKARAEAVEFPLSNLEKMPTRAWRVGSMSVGLKIKASPNDIIDFSSASLAARSKQYFRIDSTSSASASYLFNGAVFSGFAIYFDASGITVSGATFSSCYEVVSEASLDACRFDGALDPVAVSIRPDRISNCYFVQGSGGGHAIEITQPGTYSFVGNTFTGYGLDGTTDAAIYNNSGGHVTLNVSGGGNTPTVRNGVGATTDVVSGAQITVVGLAAGSQVKVTKVSNGDVLFNGAESGGQISFSTTYIGAVRVDARKASASPFYKPWATQATTISGQTVEITALQELDE